MNKSDSERLASHLKSNNYIQTPYRKEADVVVINTCGVRQSAEDRVYGLIPEIKKENPGVKLVLTGCLSERQDVLKRLKDKVDIWLPIKDLPYLKDKLKIRSDLSKTLDSNEYLRIKPELTSFFSAFIPIGNGCDNFCAYCVVPYARGREVYRPALEIIKEVEEIVGKGYKEINLIAQNVNSYVSVLPNNRESHKYFHSLGPKIDFAGLLEAISCLNGDFWIRFATSHPKDMSNKLIKTIAANKNICRHIHLPVQSGDDEVLEKMNRKYSSRHYQKLIDSIKYYIPEASITTDIIVGFPGETREQFENTVNLFQEIGFDMAYISQYSPRPGTSAAEMKDNVPPEEKKKREKELTEILRESAYKNNQKYIGRRVKVLVEGVNKKGEWYGKTDTNKNVKLNNMGVDLQVGDFIDVTIDEIWDFGLSCCPKKP